MENARWWHLVSGALTDVGEPRPDVVMDRLRQLSPAEIVEFARLFSDVLDMAYLEPLWTAAGLIEGGCGDDGFRDFRAGLILQGRAAFSAAVDDPDSLADLPLVRRMAEGSGRLGCAALLAAPRTAYRELTGDVEAFDAAMAPPVHPPSPPRGGPRALPRLTALFPD
ncbi:DUF4240 domain-containing protein [Dactylosporangium vinaceum]|uniref:DUF4240 domain-containing protein n=1 Tax=Dactylosporangium vinaceum TaxID=53362 RepID=A0ABV5MDY3_9ACTN|nr:DUF4240 domain-containing protein [Dactylosporangium vinaceum]